MQLAENISTISQREKVTLSYLFFTFLKIGCVGFGGHMALVSLIQRIMVDKDETVNDEVILDSITVASLLPGPLAVNVVANIGYHLKGRVGAFISMLGVLLPACILMLLLSWTYFAYSYKIEWAEIMYYVGGTVSAIILSTGLQLYKKEISKNYKKAALCVATIVIVSVTNSYIITIALILAGAIMGILLGSNKYSFNSIADSFRTSGKLKFNVVSSLIIGLFAVNEVLFVTNSFKSINNLILKIGVVFSGISLSLFGGGYVMIPIMQSLFVSDLHWLTTQQFVDTIAFSQATPGPILVSAVFIGYKLAGVAGAAFATIAMFAPSAILMIMVSKVFKKNKDHTLVKDMIAGIKVVVIGLIASSAIKILSQQHLSVSIAVIAIASLILSFKYKVSPVYLITASISIGILTKFLV
jgi:chromate transporter